MGVTKKDLFTETQNKIAIIAKVLAHPARIAILEKLFATEGCICNDFVLETGLTQPTISQHLKELKDSGLIEAGVKGNRFCYCINKTKLEEAQNVLGGFLGNHSTFISCCEEE